MKGPRYIRRSNPAREVEYPPKVRRDSVQFPDDATVSDESLNVTGLRERKLFCLFIWLVILSIFAIIILIVRFTRSYRLWFKVNLMLIRVLQMSHRGMRSMRIHSFEDPNTMQEEKVVHFSAPSANLGHVIA